MLRVEAVLTGRGASGSDESADAGGVASLMDEVQLSGSNTGEGHGGGGGGDGGCGGGDGGGGRGGDGSGTTERRMQNDDMPLVQKPRQTATWQTPQDLATATGASTSRTSRITRTSRISHTSRTSRTSRTSDTEHQGAWRQASACVSDGI